MTKVWDRLYLGSFKDAQQLTTTNLFGITAVVSLCAEEVRRAAGINYVQLPIFDSRPITSQMFERIMNAIEEGLRHGKLFIHCIGGASRSPIMVAAWLDRCGYKAIEKALVEISELRDTQPSPVLLQSVKEHLCR
jgi:hypothetical protein